MSEHLTNIVVCALVERDGKIFVAKRAETKSSWPGRYEIAGGHLEPGETLEEGVRREIREELNVDVEVGRIVDAFTYYSKSDDMLKVEICYLCHLAPGVEPTLNPEDHSEGRWITEAEESILEGQDEEAGALRKAFSILKGEK